MNENRDRPLRTILIIEDEDDQRSSWKREENDFNADTDNAFRVKLVLGSNEEEAYEILANQRIDGAVVDLRLPERNGSLPSAETGRRVFKKIFNSVAMPIVLLSGHPDERGEEIEGSPTHVIEKAGGAQGRALKWLAQHDQLMAALRDARNEIRRRTASIFHGHIWKRWQEAPHSSIEAIRRSVVRQIIAHVGEDLLLDPDHAEQHDLLEFYFVPSLNKGRLQTGDVCRIDGKVAVVLSPRCDMVRVYPSAILMAECKNFADEWLRLGTVFNGTSQSKIDKATEHLRNHATQKLEPRRHFLPPCGNEGPWLVDFASLRTIPSEEVQSLLEGRIASISPQFVPHLVQRFTAFAGRVGQPGLSVDQLHESAKLAAAESLGPNPGPGSQ
jgi:hypothetical protein